MSPMSPSPMTPLARRASVFAGAAVRQSPPALSDRPRQAGEVDVPQPAPDVVPLPPTRHPGVPGQTPDRPPAIPPEMPPGPAGPDIIEPTLPGEHSPVRDPSLPGEQRPRWALKRAAHSAHSAHLGRPRSTGQLRRRP